MGLDPDPTGLKSFGSTALDFHVEYCAGHTEGDGKRRGKGGREEDAVH
jgi:hypothetical protein